MEKISPIIISVTGWSGSGKTTFCEGLISELSGRGLRISAAKNSHQDLSIDKAGSDSHRFFNSGADAVCLNANNSMTIFRHRTLPDAEELRVLFAEADFIVAEGFKGGDSVRIEVTGLIKTAGEMKNPAVEAEVIIYGNSSLKNELSRRAPVGDRELQFFHRDDIIGAADYLAGLLT